MIERIGCILGIVIGIFLACFGLYLFSILPDVFTTLKHFMEFACGISGLCGGVLLIVFCIIGLIEG